MILDRGGGADRVIGGGAVLGAWGKGAGSYGGGGYLVRGREGLGGVGIRLVG